MAHGELMDRPAETKRQKTQGIATYIAQGLAATENWALIWQLMVCWTAGWTLNTNELN